MSYEIVNGDIACSLEIRKEYLKGDMKLFRHHVYEYEKGLRHLILHTTGKNFEQYVCNHL